jgi:hypothetical protein
MNATQKPYTDSDIRFAMYELMPTDVAELVAANDPTITYADAVRRVVAIDNATRALRYTP